MKSKRAGYLQKVNLGTKKSQIKTLTAVVNSTCDTQDEKTEQSECNGACQIAWKPVVAVSR